MADRVLITGARSAAALDLARDFQSAGWEAHLADCSASRIARWSSACARFHLYPSPARAGEDFRGRIAELVESHDVALIIPTCEEVFHLAAPALASVIGARLFAPPPQTLRRLHDKFAFAQACAEWALPSPESHLITDQEARLMFAGDTIRWVFKPCFSRFGESALIGPSRNALERVAIAPGRPWLAQRRVEGAEASFYAVVRQGRMMAFAAYRSDWRMRGGASYAFEPLPPKQAGRLHELAAALAQRAELTGQFSCDAIFDRDGQPWLIECNPRATSGVHLLAGGGGLARAIVGTSSEILRQQEGRAYLGPAMLAFGLPAAIGSGRLGQWRRALAGGHDVLARPGDRLPIFGAVIDSIGFSLCGLRHGITTSAATTRDIEWNGEVLP